MPESSPIPAQPVVPDFVNTLLLALADFGVPLVFLIIIATLFAIESWYANGRRIITGARAAGGVLSRAAARAASMTWTRVAVAGVSTLVSLALQIGFLAVGYVGGSYLSAPFDPARTDALLASVESEPFALFRVETVTANLKLDLIAGVHLTLIVVALLAAYRVKSAAGPMLLALPYPLIAFGGGLWVLLSILLDLLVNTARWDFTGPESWPAMRDGSGGIIAVSLFALAYVAAFLTALVSAATVRRHWTGVQD
ncbi:hypothetical protein SAMN05216298_2196 [Glycomyces sambucus]|uniref:Uncharacterized protein n=1 Tax=Glycomyces sambucus TaxID=380244 RepID=A0A1G9G3V5_9ACTN|nr:hypothetical protein [Glycomyces sambucus]SDK95326.1 hypothetical protein SAMN05216298_2196 [Glycomyces sambucus]